MLCESRMAEAPRSPLFCLGLPQPVECRLPDGEGAVGGRRECVAADGTVQQQITVWEPPERLAFRMERTDLIHRLFLSEVIERFELTALDSSTTLIERTTTARIKPRFYLLCPFFKLGLRAVHRYVFRNWALA